MVVLYAVDPDRVAPFYEAVGTGGEIYPVEHQWEFREYVVCNGIDPEGNINQVCQR